MKRTSPKRTSRTSRARPRVDATRLAVASLERIRGVVERKGKALAPPAGDQELDDRERMLRKPLPPSYRAVMQRAAGFGGRDVLLDAQGMTEKRRFIESTALIPFAESRDEDRIYCFDRKKEGAGGELPVLAWHEGKAEPVADTFAEWLDGVADRLEEQLATAADIPASLRSLLLHLGFVFDDPIVGRLETGDVPAVEELIGPEIADKVRGPHNRLFDSSGKASLTLNLDEFSLAASLRTGIFVFSAEDVFRWLRWFRDENFFGDAPKQPSHPDHARDLRRAPREPPLVLRGVVTVSALPALRHSFRAASGPSASDFYLLGRTASTSQHASSLLLHVVGGAVTTAHAIDEPLSDVHVAQDGTLWGLVPTGVAIQFAAGSARAFPLQRAGKGRAWWYGIGSAAGRVVAWGAGALLEFDGTSFVPFHPDANLEPSESVVALAGAPRGLSMLVCGESVGAVARFGGHDWAEISEDDVIDGLPIDLDVWREVAVVLEKDGRIFRVEAGAPPRPVLWDIRQEAFRTEAGGLRPVHAIRGVDGGALLASDGGVVVVGSGDPVFYAAPGTGEPARLARLGGPAAGGKDLGIAVLCGPHAWVWQNGAMSVLDMRSW